MTLVNSIGWFIAAFFFIGGVIFVLTIPEIFIGQIWIVVSLGLAALYYFLGRKAARVNQLRQEGIPGRATMLGMTQTGTQINEQPVVRLNLRAEGEGIQPLQLEKRTMVPLVALATLSGGQPHRSIWTGTITGTSRSTGRWLPAP